MVMKGVYIYGRKEVNIMTKNEYIASIMLEAAELLKNDTKQNNHKENNRKIVKTKNSYSIKDNGKTVSKLNYYNYNIKNFDWILVANLDTDPEYRRQGLATKLLNTLCEDMSKNKNKGVYMAVDVNNSNAIKLYNELNFKKIKNYESDGKKYVIMAKGNADISQLQKMNFA